MAVLLKETVRCYAWVYLLVCLAPSKYLCCSVAARRRRFFTFGRAHVCAQRPVRAGGGDGGTPSICVQLRVRRHMFSLLLVPAHADLTSVRSLLLPALPAPSRARLWRGQPTAVARIFFITLRAVPVRPSLLALSRTAITRVRL